jgi:hypothetical protein
MATPERRSEDARRLDEIIASQEREVEAARQRMGQAHEAAAKARLRRRALEQYGRADLAAQLDGQIRGNDEEEVIYRSEVKEKEEALRAYRALAARLTYGAGGGGAAEGGLAPTAVATRH